MNYPNNSAAQLLGARSLLGILFLVSGVAKIGRFAGVAGYMASKGFPMADLMLTGTIALEVLGGLALIIGWKTRAAALALIVFTGVATVLFHAFWAADSAAFQNQLNHFLKNIAIIGGLLYAVVRGPGDWSLDRSSIR